MPTKIAIPMSADAGGEPAVTLRSAQFGPHALDHVIEPTSSQLRRYRSLIWSATVILVRHAERVSGVADPELSVAGRTRADLLAHMTRNARLQAVYVTATNRSRQTGLPSALAAGIGLTEYVALDVAALAARIRTDSTGGAVLVVAHTNTIASIGAALGVDSIGEIAETTFDRLFIISRSWCRTQLLRMHYGAPTLP